MQTRHIASLLAIGLLAAVPSVARTANEIGFIEKFALAPDREKVLGELVPGTEEYYFFHALHWQNTKDAARLAQVLEQWRKRYPNSAQRKIIENREALLAYDADPQRTLQFLRDYFKLQFNHVQEARDQKPDLPSELDPARIARSVYLEHVLKRDDLQGLEPDEIEALVRDKVALRPAQRRHVLSKIIHPDIPNLLELIIEELKRPESGGFGEFPIHLALLPEQLEELAKSVPRVASEARFVYTRLKKLAPNADADAEFDTAVREAWLERLWNYARTLPPAFNTLKANILYRRLDHDRKKGIYDATRFLEYLKLPRRVRYANPRWIEQLSQQNASWSDLNADFGNEQIPLPPIGSDEALVREYFLEIFSKAAIAEGAGTIDEKLAPWAAFVQDTWLKPIFAEAMIVNGIGSPEQWAGLLSPTAFQRLKERVDVDFAQNNHQFIAPGDPVRVDLYVKNVPKLIVKVYEINTLGFFLEHRRQLNTDLNLDGLVANAEKTHTFDGDAGQSPFRRVRRTFEFPELAGRRGAWMLEFIGGGKSNRALIRSGQWHLIQHTGPVGEFLTILDENHQPARNVAAWLDGRKYLPDDKSGRILIPFTNEPGTKPIVLADAAGEFATLTHFEHHAEEYQLNAQFHIEREQLLARREATLVIRPTLTVGDTLISLDLLKQTRLMLITTTLDGVTTTRELKDLKFDSGRDFTHRFKVPDRLAKLTVSLFGKVERLSQGGEMQEVFATYAWNVNGIEKIEATNDTHLSVFGGNHVFELLGKNGEPVADQQVLFEFHRRGFNHTVKLPLRTDAKGRIALGPLTEIDRLQAQAPNGRKGDWRLKDSERTWPTVIQVTANQPFEVPLEQPFDPDSYSLLEVRGGQFVSKVERAVVTPPEPGARLMHLAFAGLAPGDYWLRLHREKRTITICVTEGPVVDGWAFGDARTLEIRNIKPLRVDRVVPGEKEVVIRVANANPNTRVHVAATRFKSWENLFTGLSSFPRFSPASSTPARMPNLYASGREIGDEYRYILERRFGKIFPGNMLARPGLLLNPWELRATDLRELAQQAKQAASATRGGRAASERRRKPEATPPEPRQDLTEYADRNLDFLATAAPAYFNLVPDADGQIKIDRALLGDRQHIQVYAADLHHAAWQSVSLDEVATKFEDLRLSQSLDPDKSFTETRKVSLLKKGDKLTLENVLTGEMETYDSLGGAYSLLMTLSNNQELPKFACIVQWPKLSDEAKRQKYSEFACHELNFFLSQKDPEFFAKVVQPYLRNKKDKTFMDEYLIGADLRPHLEPWRFSRLNAAERALLASRLPGESANLARHLRELWELLRPDPAEQERLFETALRGRALDGGDGDKSGIIDRLEAQRTELRREKAASSGLQDAPDAAKPPAPPASAAAAPPVELAAKAERFARDTELAALQLTSERKKLGANFGRAEARAEDSETIFAGLVNLEEAELGRLGATVRTYFRKLGPTKEWAENNYWHLPIEKQDASLITVNGFWRDYAAWIANGAQRPFVSEHLAEAHRNFAEIMLALSVLDLPFEAPEHQTEAAGDKFTLTAGGTLIVFHKEIQPAKPAGEEAKIQDLLVSESFFRQGDRFRQEGNEKFDKYVTDEFLAGVVYGGNVVVTNPSSAPAKVDLLLQIPAGALPVLGSKPTKSQHVRLEPYTTQRFEYYFYFPQTKAGGGAFAHFPVNASISGVAVAAAKVLPFNVVDKLSQVDKASWDYVSQYGTDQEVFAFLEQNNIQRLDVSRVAWRARQSVDFFRKLVALLEQRHRFDGTIYSYALLHNETAPLGRWLRHQDSLLNESGRYLTSRLVTIDPIERRSYQHLEYSPLVNQRAHQLGSERRIANSVLLAQYRQLCEILSYKPALDPMDQMSVVYYLFLQDRVAEALARLEAIDPNTLPTRLQYDYFQCYAAFYQAKLPEARQIATQHASHPVARWRDLFQQVLAQLDEIEGKQPKAGEAVQGVDRAVTEREKSHAELAATEPSFDFKVENRTIALAWQNLGAVTVNYYLIDPEFSFSSSPFVSQDASRFSVIKPTLSTTVELPKDQAAMEIPLPANFAQANVLIEILGSGQRKAQVYHANTMRLTLAENYGRLEVRDQATARPVPKAYVKVYARLRNGMIRFFKDGYTDLRGKFDYASLNSSDNEQPVPLPVEKAPVNELDYQMLKPGELGAVERLAILVLSETNGATVREVQPPSQ